MESKSVENKLYKNLRNLLKENKITFEKLADKVNLPVSTIKGWSEAPSSPRDLPGLYRVALYFSVSLDELLFSEEPKKYKDINIHTKGVTISISVNPTS